MAIEATRIPLERSQRFPAGKPKARVHPKDCLLITRTFLIKLKRLLDLKLKTEKGEAIDAVVNSYKPSIFWKDKEEVKMQIKIWSLTEIHKLLSQINETELKIKKNIDSGLLILSDFLITKSKTLNN